MRDYFTHALPTRRQTLAGGALWALATTASAAFGLLLDGWHTPQKILSVCAIFAAGGALAFPVALWLARLLASGRRAEQVFAATFLCLVMATIGFTGGLYALQYRLYYSEWHAPAFTKLWLIEYVFTVAVALYQFAVLGIRLYFPFGIVALFTASLWFARAAR